jgi:hypothetical protein
MSLPSISNRRGASPAPNVQNRKALNFREKGHWQSKASELKKLKRMKMPNR